MNFFGQAGDIAKGMMNYMNHHWVSGQPNQAKESTLRKNLQTCTYPDETKYMIEKAVKQVFHVYPFFNADIIMFTQNGFQRRFLEIKGIIEIEIKKKTCKVDFNMMLPNDFPRSPPYVRIINRNPDYKVDPYYQHLQSKSDKSSYILNEKLNACKNWHPSNSLVNLIIQCYDMLKTRFPFSKNQGGQNNQKSSPWDTLYGQNNNNNNWNANNNNWPKGNTGNNVWGNNAGGNQHVNWGNNNNNWGAQGQGQGWGQAPVGGMGGIIGAGGMMAGGNMTNVIANGQKFVGNQKKTLSSLNAYYIKGLDKNQHLDTLRQSLQTQQNTLRRQTFQMNNFLSESEQKGAQPDLTSFVNPANDFSQQVLDLMSSNKAREDCIIMLENRFNQEELSLDDFMKQVRKMEEMRFQEKVLLSKCVKQAI